VKPRALALVVLAACTAPRALPASRPAPPAPGAERRPRDERVERALAAMSRARELPVLREVRAAVVGREELMRALERHIAREVPRAEIENERIFLATIGAIAPIEDYEGEVLGALRRDAGGMYLPERSTMFLPDDLGAGALAGSIAHEAVHALQDQHFGLEAFERYLPGRSDTMLARACLAEGDALVAADEAAQAPSGPSYVAREIAAPYTFGAPFVRALRARGGWAEVNRAWRRGGLTTEQVLHPEKWASGEGALAVPPPTFAALGPGFRRVAVDSRGELGLRLVLESGVASSRAAAGAAGWGGDAAVVAGDGARFALAWRVRYDDEAAARRGRDVMAEALAGGRPCRDERASPTSVARDGRDVLALVGPAGSSCALLEAWSKEVFAR
jgi:hypothetical protein